ncbi:STY4851/ECs_5259 family protein [Niveibacterium sp. SC-1]|uniref:STY4851/ECs_5259 family protein n=1 Tax=Niveibacterium sp. SC-1 TaxID=3135646 RepID=UPI00311F09C5
MSVQDTWLGEFFESRNLSGPDGRMLYAYRLSEKEYHSLRTNLETWVAGGSFSRLAQRDAAFCARFVLFASEWWHREYAGGAWRWEPIIELIDRRHVVEAGSRTACVKRGFAFWGHQTDSSGKKFLGAVVAHGGLPLRALGQGIGTVSRILRDGLRLAARYGWQEEQLVAAIGERAVGLPESLRKEDIYRLLATMVLTAMELRMEYKLAGRGDPIAVLQAGDGKWMERFPISLEESAATPLLTDLLKEAAAQRQAAPTAVFSVRRSLMAVSEGAFELRAVVSAPRQAPADQLAAALGLRNAEVLPSYFSIDLAGDSESWLEGRLLLGQTQSARMDGGTRTLCGARALEDLAVVVRRRATPIGEGPCALPGGAAVPIDQPWVFAEREGTWLLAAVGGARLPEQLLRVALPAGWRLMPESDAGSTAMSRLGCLRVEGYPDMELYAISASVRAESDNECFHIRSGQSAKLTETLSWVGKRLPWQPKRYAAFRGVPVLYRLAEDGTRTRVPAADVVWNAVGGSRAVLAPHAIQGLVDAYCIQGGETLTRTRMLVLADSANIEFLSGLDINTGALRFHGFGGSSVAVVSANVVGCGELRAGELILNLCANEMPPETVTIGVMRSGQELHFVLPFPSTGGRFFDGDAHVMRDREQLSLRDLAGCRLRIFDQNPDRPKRYALRLSLSCTDTTTRVLDEEIPLSLPPNGVVEFRLIDVHRNIETMLSFSDELDAKVSVSLTISDRVASSIEVSRYATHLEHAERGLLSLATTGLRRADMEALGAVRLMAAPLLHANSEPQELEQETSEGVLTASWKTTALAAERGPWLIFPAPDSSITVRPLIWGPQLPELQSDTCALGLAMAEAEASARVVAIDAALRAMSENYSDGSWSLLDYLCKAFAHLPLSALDVFRVTVSEPAYAVAFALRAEGNVDNLCRRFGSELGFVWELTSPSDWVAATRRLRAYYATQLPPESLARIFPLLLKDRCDKLADALPSMRLMLELAGPAGGCAPSSEYVALQEGGAASATQTCQDLWKGEASLVQSVLLRGHEGQTWPDRDFWQLAVKELTDRMSAETKRSIGPSIQALFWETGGHKMSVANMPVICALWTTTGTQTAWWRDGINRQALRRLRAFDPEWFKQAYLAGLRACLGFGLSANFVIQPSAARTLGGSRVFTRAR